MTACRLPSAEDRRALWIILLALLVTALALCA